MPDPDSKVRIVVRHNTRALIDQLRSRLNHDSRDALIVELIELYCKEVGWGLHERKVPSQKKRSRAKRPKKH